MELHEIVNKHPEQKERVERLQKNEKTAKMLLKLKDSGGMKLIISQLEQMIESINDKLRYERELTEIERHCLFERRDCWGWLLEQFDNQNQILNRIEEYKKKYE